MERPEESEKEQENCVSPTSANQVYFVSYIHHTSIQRFNNNTLLDKKMAILSSTRDIVRMPKSEHIKTTLANILSSKNK